MQNERTRKPRSKHPSTARTPVPAHPAFAASGALADTDAAQTQPGHVGRMPTPIDPLLDDRDLERLTGGKRSTWQKRRLTGDGPPFIRIGGRLVRYRRSEVEAWLAAIPSLRSTSQADA
jgi:predicted DNA-binding transcriptional regulator AlpA